MNRFHTASVEESEEGLTLIELVITVFIFGLLTTLVFNLFQTSRLTTENVQSSSTSISVVQTASGLLAKQIRNAVKAKVSDDGSRLDMENTDGTCTAWVYYEGNLHSHQGGEATEFSSDWRKSLEAVTVGSNGFFQKSQTAVSYGFSTADKLGTNKIEGEARMRVPALVQTSSCFGDPPPSTSTPSPTPTVPPVTTYTIEYALGGGSGVSNPTSYDGTATITLNNPGRSGYTFAGWTGVGLSGPTMTVTIPAGSTGNRGYTATWTANPVTPTPTPTPSAPAADFIGSWENNIAWPGTIDANIFYKNNSGAPVNSVKIKFKVPGATGIAGSNLVCSYEGNNTFTCVTPGWNSIMPGSISAYYYIQLNGPTFVGGSAPIAEFISIEKNS